ncbi:MAG: hypothetical protein AB2598_19810 [Candidatus Thiodiazotropha sp.]
MKYLWLILLIFPIYIAFKFMDTAEYQRTIKGKVVEVNTDSIAIKTTEGNIEKLPKFDFKLGQSIEVEVLKTRFTGNNLYQITNILTIEINSGKELSVHNK